MDRTRTSIPLAAVPRPGRDSGDSRGCVYAPAPTTTRSLAPRALAPARRAEWRTPSGTSRRRDPCCPPSLRRWLLLRWSRRDGRALVSNDAGGGPRWQDIDYARPRLRLHCAPGRRPDCLRNERRARERDERLTSCATAPSEPWSSSLIPT